MHKYLKGFMLGAAGGALGTFIMGGFMQGIQPLLPEPTPPEKGHEPSSISLTGKHFRKGQDSTEATARVLYKTVMAREPSKETRQALGQAVHWGFGLTMAGLYGSLRAADAEGADLLGGILFGTGVWLLFSELMVPVLGLAPSPTEEPLPRHLQHMTGHFVYGIVTSATAQVLKIVLDRAMTVPSQEHQSLGVS